MARDLHGQVHGDHQDHGAIESASRQRHKVVTIEAMKMQTTIYAHADGVVAELHVTVGDSVEASDLLMKLRA